MEMMGRAAQTGGRRSWRAGQTAFVADQKRLELARDDCGLVELIFGATWLYLPCMTLMSNQPAINDILDLEVHGVDAIHPVT
jgi:hypothetical protein